MTVRLRQIAARAWRQLLPKADRAGLTFRQAAGLFYGQHGYYPPADIPLMPTRERDWWLPVADVPRERLRP